MRKKRIAEKEFGIHREHRADLPAKITGLHGGFHTHPHCDTVPPEVVEGREKAQFRPVSPGERSSESDTKADQEARAWRARETDIYKHSIVQANHYAVRQKHVLENAIPCDFQGYGETTAKTKRIMQATGV